MDFIWVEAVVRGLGGIMAYLSLGILLFGIWRGTRRKAGRMTGRSGTWLRSIWFYLITSLIFFGISYLGWVRLPLEISKAMRGWLLASGVLLYFPGVAFILRGRFALGKTYFVSTGEPAGPPGDRAANRAARSRRAERTSAAPVRLCHGTPRG